MARYVAALALLGAVLADGTGHHHTDHGAAAAPSAGGYAAPAASYGAPADTGYAAPQNDYAAPTYDAPATGYGEPTGYDAPSYNAVQDTVDGFDLAKITELLPLFVAVFAAIIIAQLVAPLFGMLLNAKVTALGGIFTPLVQVKADLINAILNPLGLALGATATCTNFQGRSMPDEFSFDALKMIEIAQNLYEFSSKFNLSRNVDG